MELSQRAGGTAKRGPSFGGRSSTSRIPDSIRVHQCSSVVEFLSACIVQANTEWIHWLAKNFPAFEPVDLGLSFYQFVRHNSEGSFLTLRKKG
jgi:hypothetical protein